jgi:hypothetical protein
LIKAIIWLGLPDLQERVQHPHYGQLNATHSTTTHSKPRTEASKIITTLLHLGINAKRKKGGETPSRKNFCCSRAGHLSSWTFSSVILIP